VDGCVQGVVQGWLRLPPDSRQRPLIEVLVDGAVAGTGIAALPREDLELSGVGDGAYGFAIPLDPAVWAARRDDVVQAEVRLCAGDILPGGSIELTAPCFGDEVAAAPPGTVVWPPLPWTLQRGGVHGYIDRWDSHVHGWAQRRSDPRGKVVFKMFESGVEVGQITADRWRKDLEETRQGDGRWSILSPLPAALCDGRVHAIQLLLEDNSPAVDFIIYVQSPRQAGSTHGVPAPPSVEEGRTTKKHRPARNDAPAGIMFSIVVNFYNMAREAERTLTSLQRQYQRRIGDLRYEVLCVDNFSDPPLSAEWVASFGPEFRLITPSRRLKSPCAAINEAAAQAAGRYICIMIDGAHILTPGVLREVWDAVTEAPEAVVALRQWFVGGDQRWLAAAGYTPHQEDMIFDKIEWPSDGYGLFCFGTPIWESPNHWFDGMIESNCLFMPAELYRRIGGMDEAFDEAGAGFANLDLFRRAALESVEPVIALIGEASFHQFHGGTTTNVDLSVKATRVRGYENKYVELRGAQFSGVRPVDIRVRGQMQTLQAVMGRQRPLSPARIGVTDKVRPGSLPMHFDENAQDYLQSVYVECGLHRRATWLGAPIGIAPSDALTIQDLIVRLMPGRIVTLNAAPGLLGFLDSVLGLAGLPSSRIVAAGDAAPDGQLPRSVLPIEGAPIAPETLAAVARALGTDAPVIVLFTPSPGDTLPIEALTAYAAFVTPRSYLVFLGTSLGQPWLGYSKHWYMTAIRQLLARQTFAIDTYLNPHLVTTSPLGYLQRL
jgi:cephalosporin hydroxylase